MGFIKYLPGALGVICWGTLGIFFVLLERQGHSTLSVLSAGLLLSAVILFIYLLIREPKKLIPDKKLLYYALIVGLVGMVLINLAYIEGLKHTSVAIAVLLISTAPFFVLFINLLFYRNKLNWIEITAITVAVAGISLALNITANASFNIEGLLWGLLSGFCFGIYIILGTKAANEGVDNLALLVYSFLIGAVVVNIIYPSADLLMGKWDTLSLIYLMMWVLISNIGGWALYNWGLNLIPSNHSALLAVLEPVSGLVGSVFVLGDKLLPVQIIGILITIAAIGSVIWSGGRR